MNRNTDCLAQLLRAGDRLWQALCAIAIAILVYHMYEVIKDTIAETIAASGCQSRDLNS